MKIAKNVDGVSAALCPKYRARGEPLTGVSPCQWGFEGGAGPSARTQFGISVSASPPPPHAIWWVAETFPRIRYQKVDVILDWKHYQ